MPFEKSAAHSGADAVTEGKDALTLPEKEVVGYNAPQDKVVAGFQKAGSVTKGCASCFFNCHYFRNIATSG